MNNPAESFLEYRNLLFSIAYNMLGQVETAQDIVQDTFLSWTQVDTVAVRTRSTSRRTRKCSTISCWPSRKVT